MKVESYAKRLLNEKQARMLKGKGYMFMDTHVHTSYSYDVANVPETSPEKIIALQSRLGMIKVITDHDTLDGYFHLKRQRLHKDVIPAVEIRIKPAHHRLIEDVGEIHTLHINVYGLNRSQFLVLEKIAYEQDLDAFAEYLRDEKLKWTYNHPFWQEHHEKLNWKAVPLLAKHYFDILEINADRSFVLNNVTIYIAEQLHKGIVAGTDTHTGNPCKAFVIAKGNDFEEFWGNIRQRRMYIVRQDLTPMFIAQETSRIISQVFAANAAQMKAKKFRMSSGVRAFDNLAKRVSYGEWKNRHAFKMVVKNILKGFTYSIGPIMAWYFYTRDENRFGEHIKHPIKKIVKNTKDKNVM